MNTLNIFVTANRLLFFLVFIFGLSTHCKGQDHINRKKVVTRHNVHLIKSDTLGSLTVGNGKFAFTVDATGLQTFPDDYKNGIPLGTQSEWGWDSYANPQNFRFEETLVNYEQFGRKIPYPVQVDTPERKKKAIDWFRQNPHLVQLGNLGLELYHKDGRMASLHEITDISQSLNLWTGEIESRFSFEGDQITVFTVAHQEVDAVAFHIKSKLLGSDQLKIRLRIPFPNGNWKDTGTQWESEHRYSTELTDQTSKSALFQRKMDSLTYSISLAWEGEASVNEKEANYYLLQPKNGDDFSFSCTFATRRSETEILKFEDAKKSSILGWERFWRSGGIVDFSQCTDLRANELERRVVLSQYLTKLQCTGSMPPQETGLTYNSWYGRPHLEMHWWHGLHFSLWGRANLLENSLPWYKKVLGQAQKIAQKQGFIGVRWPKMTDPYGGEAPSSVGSFLIWQQPHIISLAESIYRLSNHEEILQKYAKRVYATADFMATFAQWNANTEKYVLGPGIIPAQETHSPFETFNPTYELGYWEWGLQTAIEWKKRRGEVPPPLWVKVANGLSPLPVKNGVYLAAENALDSYENPRFMRDHPSVFGVFGMLPETQGVDKKIMKNTFDLIWDKWSWDETWGWDFPLTAMTAARLGMPDKAVDALFMDVQTNTYLPNGHNYQDERLTLYLPGNGGLLAAVAMMCAGWDGNTVKNPGFPSNGKWKVRWEGLNPMF